MIGSFLGAWLLFPLVLLVASAGSGLLVRAVAGGELPLLLVAPVGFALLVVICSFTTSYDWLAPAAAPLIVLSTVAGLAVEARKRGLRRVRVRFAAAWVWPLLAALVAFAAVGGPVFLTGSVGWTGFSRIVDIAFQMDFAEHLANAGRAMPANGNSSYDIVVSKLLGIGYPGGGQATLGVMAKLARVNVAWCYQPFLAFASAMGALAIFSTLGLVTRNPVLRCVGAAVAIEPNILYGYTLEAGIKELTTVVLLMVLVALLVRRLQGADRPGWIVPAAVAASGAFGSFSLGAAPWMGLLLVGALLVTLIKRAGHWRVLKGWALFAVVAIVISIPGLITAAKLASVAGPAIGGVVNLGLGNLASPVSRWAAAGVYLTGDYRYPLVHVTASHVFDVLVIVLAAIGVLAAVMRRRWSIVVIAAAAAIALYYYLEHSTAWIQLKAFTLTSVFVVMLAFVGVAALDGSGRRALRLVGWVAAAAVTGAVLYGNALIYHDTTLAPGARYRNLAQLAAKYAGKGPALDPYFDEYAEFFLREANGSTIVDPANLRFQVRPGVPTPPGGVSFAWDLNQLVPSYVQSFPLIIQPRNPLASRAPSNYDLVELTPYFEVWRRDRPASGVLAHLPLSNLPHERTRKYCAVFDRVAKRAGAGTEVAYAKSSTAAAASPVEGQHPSYWVALGPATLAALGRGVVTTRVKLPRSGHFSVWLQGSVGRPITVYIDGRRLASIGYEERYPGEYLLVGHASLTAGEHAVRLVRGNGTLHPGSGDPTTETGERTVGAVVFDAEGPTEDRVYVAPAARAAQICAAPVGYEWLEVLRPGTAPADALDAPA